MARPGERPRMETVEHDGRTTAYRRTGDGPPVVFVHGSGATHRVWVEQYGRHDAPYEAVAVDLSGHGDSDDVDAEAGEETLDAYADDVLAVAREVGAPVLVGNSLGGAVVQHVAVEREYEAAGYVLCGTGAKLGVRDDLLEMLAGDFESFVEAIHGEDMLLHDADEEVVAASREGMHEVGRAVTERDFRTCDAFDVRGRLDAVAVPCLAITGEHDRLTPVEFHEYLAEHLPEGRLAVVAEAAHLSFLERPDAWNSEVDAFVRSVA